MTALQRLRSRIRGNARDYDSDVTDTCTIELTEGTTLDMTEQAGQASWIQTIQDGGNKAEDWLKFTQYMKNTAQYNSVKIYTSYMTSLYARAIKAIDSEVHKDSISYALLLINCANFKSTFSIEDARSLLHYARNSIKRLAIVHIASAQLEVSNNNWMKARRLLDKAQILGVKPEGLLILARKNLNMKHSPLIPDQNEEEIENKENVARTMPSVETSDEMRALSSDNSDDVDLPLNVPIHVTTRSRKSGSALDKLNVMSLQETNKPERTFYTDVIVRADRHHSESSDDGERPRVPYSPPLQTIDTSPMETTVSFADRGRTCRTSGNISDDTLPAPFDPSLGEYKRTLTKFNSTPDCKNPGFVSMSTKKTRFLGKPQRVKRTSLPQLNEGFKASTDDDTDNFKMCPLPETDLFNVATTDEDQLHLSRSRICSVEMMDSESDLADEADGDHHSNDNADRGKQDADSGVVMPGEKALGEVGHELMNKSTGSTATVSTVKAATVANVNNSQPTPRPILPQVAAPSIIDVPVVSNPQIASMPSAGVTPMAGTPMMMTQGRPTETLVLRGKMYTVLRVLGQGGSSKVYDTFDANFNLRAIKCVDLNAADEATVESYKNEIALLRRLQHSNKVVKLYDYEYVDNILYVVMERGDTDLSSLFRQCTKSGGIDTLMQKFYWKEMVKAVQVLHKEGIVHSDLKPANFLLVAGNLKLIDFGIAKALHQDMTSVTRDQQVGTLNYMSPEAILDTGSGTHKDANGRTVPKIKLGVKSDVWSLGCILYNLMYGKTPFHHISNVFLKLQAITNPQVEIDFPETVDCRLREILMKCLRRDPKERPSIDEILILLKKL